MREPESLGRWLAAAQQAYVGWKYVMFAVLALAVVLNFFILPHEAEFVLDAYPGFWAVFGLAGAVVMGTVLKKLVFPILSRGEDYYDRT